MKTIKLWISDHADRMNMLDALQGNDYDATITIDTAYMPPRPFVVVKVDDWEVEE